MACNRLKDITANTSEDNAETIDEKDDKVEESETETSEKRELREKYQSIKTSLDELECNINLMEKLKTEDRQTQINKEHAHNEKEMNKLLAETNIITKKIKQDLENKKIENTALVEKEAKKYKKITQSFKQKQDECLRRRLRLIDAQGGKMTEEQIDNTISGGYAYAFIQEASTSGELNQMIADIEKRHQDIVSLEVQVMEVFHMFQDLATLVDAADERLAIIENHIAHTKECAEHGEENLHDAIEYQKKTHKRNCIILSICLVVLIIVVSPIFGAIAG